MTGRDIKAVRKAMGMSQVKFAKAMNVSFCSLNRWENGHNVPQPDRMEKLMGLQKAQVGGKSGRKKFDAKDIARIVWHASDGSVDVIFKDNLVEPFTKEEFKKDSRTRKFIEEMEKIIWAKVDKQIE